MRTNPQKTGLTLSARLALPTLWLAFLLFSLGTPHQAAFAQGSATPPLVVVLTVKGPLTPVLVEFVSRSIGQANDRLAELVVIQLDTPGGSIDLMNRMVQDIRGSRVPVVVYVAPRNAMAGSAGTVITLAGHLAAMAPETTIGAASPVGAQGEDIGTTLESKVKEMLKAEVRGLTQNRPPQAIQLAQDAIETARAATVDEALAVGLVDIKATDLGDLLQQLDGRKVVTAGGEITLHTRGASIENVGVNVFEQILQFLVDPNVVFILLSIGVQAILIELANPGGWVPGFVGVVCVLLAIYGLGILPVNWFGILFMLVAFVLFVVEIKTPTHGALTVAGGVSFITGALVLFNSTPLPGFPLVSIPLVIGTAIILAASFFTIISFAIRAQRKPLLTGQALLIGRAGMVRIPLNPVGQVQVAGEMWAAELEEGEAPLPEGVRVDVVDRKGLRLVVRKQAPTPPAQVDKA